MLADIDATCASLGCYDENKYIAEPDALLGLKVNEKREDGVVKININLCNFVYNFQHLIWILRRDADTHEYRRHLGSGKVLQTDLLPLLISQTDETEMSDVLLRLLVNLTNPTLLLYREEIPKDGPNRRIFMHLVEILQSYKGAFALEPVWAALGKRFQKVLGIVSRKSTCKLYTSKSDTQR